MVLDRKPRGYWRFVVAAVGWLILTGAANVPSPGNGEPADGSAKQIEAAAQSISGAIRDAAKPGEHDPGCPDRKDKRESDLCAQWKAADAAKEATDYSFWTLIVSAIGTSLLVWTLWETRLSSRRQLRAYVMLDQISGDIAGDGFKAKITWINCGQTPAHDLRIATGVDIAPIPNFRNLPAFDDGVSHVGSGKGFTSQIEMGPHLFAGRDPSTNGIWIYARVVYRDIFNRRRKTDLCAEYIGNGGFRAAPSHNIAT